MPDLRLVSQQLPIWAGRRVCALMTRHCCQYQHRPVYESMYELHGFCVVKGFLFWIKVVCHNFRVSFDCFFLIGVWEIFCQSRRQFCRLVISMFFFIKKCIQLNSKHLHKEAEKGGQIWILSMVFWHLKVLLTSLILILIWSPHFLFFKFFKLVFTVLRNKIIKDFFFKLVSFMTFPHKLWCSKHQPITGSVVSFH